MSKNNSWIKILLAIASLIITFFVWQQGLKESLNRPSVSFDITQKEIEITELAMPAVPENLKIFFPNSGRDEMKNSLSKLSFNELSERSRLIWIILQNLDEKIDDSYYEKFNKPVYRNISQILYNSNSNKSYELSGDLINDIRNDIRNDKYLFNLVSDKFNFNKEKIITNKLAKFMFFKLIMIRLIPLLSILIGSLLVFKSCLRIIKLRAINWADFTPLDLNVLDMIILVSGGFVVLGEVISPLISITLVDLFSKNLTYEISQSLKIFFGYLFMAMPPLYILYRQIKFIDKRFSFEKDYFELRIKPIKDSISQGFKGWIMIIPFVLLTSLIMNLIFENQAGSNPLLEIVLNNNNYFAFILLFLTTTLIAPFFEEIIFRGVLLPVLARDYGKTIGILISSFVFALAHLSLNEFPPLFVLGIGLATTRLISGKLSSSIFMHSFWNGLTFFNLFLLRT
tara:strand:+ start:116 stop:1480 length:1365 start_codon:yes stop_codon:yes gene_type:complete